jgi:hypothetical protein
MKLGDNSKIFIDIPVIHEARQLAGMIAYSCMELHGHCGNAVQLILLSTDDGRAHLWTMTACFFGNNIITYIRTGLCTNST